MRGVRFIDVGFMQTGAVTHRHYNVDATHKHVAPDDASRIGEMRDRNKQPLTYPMLDTLNNNVAQAPNEAENRKPWYDSQHGGLFRAASKFDWPATGEGIDTTASDGANPLAGTIMTTDTPWNQTASVNMIATSNSLVMDFTIILAAHTSDAVNDSERLYFKRAQAPWTFNGSGTITKGVWQPIQTVTGNYSGQLGTDQVDLAPSPAGTAVLGGPLDNATPILNESLNVIGFKKNTEMLEIPSRWKLVS